MTNSALQIVQNFQQSMGAGTSEWESLFADDISFIGPVDQVKGKAANIELNKNFFPLVKGYEPKSMIEQGDRAVIEGSYTIATPQGKTIEMACAEIYEVKEGKIQNIRIYYDAEEFRKAFAPVS